MVNEKIPNCQNQLTLIERNELIVNGANALGSYDEKEVTLDTGQGTLIVKGEKLNIKQLNLEDGKISIEGNIKSIQYAESRKERCSILERFLK